VPSSQLLGRPRPRFHGCLCAFSRVFTLRVRPANPRWAWLCGPRATPVSVAPAGLTETGAGSHRTLHKSTNRAAGRRPACVLMPGGIHPQLNRADRQCDSCSITAAGTWRASALFMMRALHECKCSYFKRAQRAFSKNGAMGAFTETTEWHWRPTGGRYCLFKNVTATFL